MIYLNNVGKYGDFRLWDALFCMARAANDSLFWHSIEAISCSFFLLISWAWPSHRGISSNDCLAAKNIRPPPLLKLPEDFLLDLHHSSCVFGLADLLWIIVIDSPYSSIEIVI